ncbi:MAG TPA: ABC transporter substrate-binding protein [Paucimonas sp.]|nr:ABC transporter substrate-binding protein [Paucimonas sp.]HJW54542.1 ABC transporter substrate-binding protein [Burkholderiaceae bacterium]
MMFMFFLRAALKTALVSMAFCALPASASGNVIVIGQAIDLSGPNASIGRDYVAGIKTCFDMMNANGGINGRRIQYLARDDHGQPDIAARLVADLIELDHAEYLLGGVGDESVRAVVRSAAFRNSSYLLFAPLAAGNYAIRDRVLFWRPGYQQEVRHILRHFGKLGMKNVAVAYQETASNADAYKNLNAELTAHRMTLSATVRIDADGASVAQTAERLVAAKPDLVLVIADTINTALFLKNYRQHGGQAFVAGTSLINLDTLRELAGTQAIEWTVFSQVVPDPGAGTSVLQMEHLNMMRKYRDEAVSSLTLEGFAAAKALAKAIQQAKMPGRALHEFMEKNGVLDLGGLTATASGDRNYLSNYLDIALYRKGSGLRF